MNNEAGPAAKTLYRRVLANREAEKAHILFDVGVLERYRAPGFRIIRTNTVGRLSSPSWRMDFGISAGERTIHASLANLFRLPDAEREHWATHLAGVPLSENYLKMLLHPGSCIDDGDTRDW